MRDTCSPTKFRRLGEDWPAKLENPAIAVVGGWYLVVVDSVDGKVWQFLNVAADTVRLTTTAAPSSTRKC